MIQTLIFKSMLNICNPNLSAATEKAVVKNLRFQHFTFACENKQGNLCKWHKSFTEACLRKVQHYLPF